MKFISAFLFASLCSSAFANNLPTPKAESNIEHFHWGQKLDIAKVLSTTEVPDVCGVVPVRMTYLDSAGNVHTLEYLVMGNGCSGG
ncbi:DUF2790 domain-containing protein [Pseudomonas putida]|nr:DUF2790 domain-containing protein [Pseudomonas putida]